MGGGRGGRKREIDTGTLRPTATTAETTAGGLGERGRGER